MTTDRLHKLILLLEPQKYGFLFLWLLLVLFVCCVFLFFNQFRLFLPVTGITEAVLRLLVVCTISLMIGTLEAFLFTRLCRSLLLLELQKLFLITSSLYRPSVLLEPQKQFVVCVCVCLLFFFGG